MNDILIRNVTKRYGSKTVLSNLSYRFPGGQTTCVMGPSGCGKTTLMRLILGLETPEDGEILLPEGARLSCVFQEDRLVNHMSAVKNCRLVLRGQDEKIIETLTKLGLGDSMHKPVRLLSGGMARRVSVARALAANADIVIMDEPFKGLDEDTRARAAGVIQEALRGRTLLLVTHDPDEAVVFGGRILDFNAL
jgi:ABC-type nitrate/sulfonate/bicarbonate transport system, ATPase component